MPTLLNNVLFIAPPRCEGHPGTYRVGRHTGQGIILVGMKVISYVLNLPWTIVGLAFVFISVPKKVRFAHDAIVINVRSFWWAILPFMKGVRAMVQGNIVLLGPSLEAHDLEHEMVHIRQNMRRPLLQPLLYFIEACQHGSSPRNKYEEEAYRTAGNIYRTTL